MVFGILLKYNPRLCPNKLIFLSGEYQNIQPLFFFNLSHVLAPKRDIGCCLYLKPMSSQLCYNVPYSNNFPSIVWRFVNSKQVAAHLQKRSTKPPLGKPGRKVYSSPPVWLNSGLFYGQQTHYMLHSAEDTFEKGDVGGE